MSIDAFTIVLGAIVLVLSAIDFLLGKQGRKELQSRIETYWLKLSYIKLPALGINEATGFVRFIDIVFGSRLFSVHRVISTSAFVALMICLGYFVIEGARIATGHTLRWPFVGVHWATGFPVQVLPAMVSISISRGIVAGSIRLFGRMKWGTLPLLVAVGTAGYLSVIIPITVSFGFVPAEYMVRDIVDYALTYVTKIDEANSTEERQSVFYFAPLAYAYTMIGVSLSKVALLHPYSAFQMFMGLAFHNDMVRGLYDFFIAMGVGGIRIVFAVAFFGSWVFLTPLQWISSLLLLRLSEADRGALTIVATGLALLAKIVQEITRAAL